MATQVRKSLLHVPRNSTCELDSFTWSLSERKFKFVNIVFLPFNLQWQFVLSVTIMIRIILTIYESVFHKSTLGNLASFSLSGDTKKMFYYFSEVYFWLDYLLLLLHRNCKQLNEQMPHLPKKLHYFFIMLLTLISIPFVLQTETFKIELVTSTDGFFKYFDLFILLRLLRVISFLSYLMSSIYLTLHVCVIFFSNLILMIAVIFACLLYISFIDRNFILGPVERKFFYVVPMFNEGIFSSWPMYSVGDVALLSYYIVANCFLLRGTATIQHQSVEMSLIMELYMYLALTVSLMMISFYIVTLIQLQYEEMLSTIRMESLCSRLKHAECNKVIIDQIESYFINANKMQGGNLERQMKTLLPSTLYQIYTLKVYGPAFRSSHLFRMKDAGFLSAVALNMKTEFHFPGHVITSEGKVKHVFIYLKRGIIQVMSCFDSSTPILSFFPGTCLGESSIIFQQKSTSRVVCATHCQLLILYKKDFDRLGINFKSEIEELRDEVTERYRNAKLNYRLKLMEFTDHYSDGVGHQEPNSLKKIKRMARMMNKNLFKKPVSHLRYEDLFFQTAEAEKEMKEYMNSHSNYLDMFVISENTERIRDDITFLTHDFPLILHPKSPIITFWNSIILVLVSIELFCIPLYILTIDIEKSYFVAQTFFIIDLFAQCTFAVFTPEKDLITVKDIFFYRLTTATYWADVSGSIPLTFVASFVVVEYKIFYGMIQFNHLLRSWRIIHFFNNQIHKFPRFRILLYTTSFVFYFGIFMWYSSIILIIISCEDLNKCDPNCMLRKIIKVEINQDTDPYFLESFTFFILTRIALGLSGVKYVPFTFYDHLFVLMNNLIVSFALNFFIAFLSLLAIIMFYSKKKLSEKKLKLLQLSKNYKLETDLNDRMLRRLILQKQIEDSEIHLRGRHDFAGIARAVDKDLKFDLWGDLLRECTIFQGIDGKLARLIASKLRQIILQPQEFVCFCGVFCPFFYIIHRGYCEVIDAVSGVVQSTKGPGYEFGVLEMCLDIPMLQSIRTTTYCEFIYMEKKDFSDLLEKFPDYKEQIQATKKQCLPMVDLPVIEGWHNIKRVNLSDKRSFHYFGFNMIVGSKEERAFFDPIFKAGRGAILLSYFMMRATILPTGNAIWCLELVRSCFALISSIVFPSGQILSATYDHMNVVYLILDITVYIDIYLRCHVAYFNKKGVLVTHPLYTFINYAKTSLPLDLLACFPFEILLRHLVEERYVFMLQYNRILQVYRLFGLLDYIYNSKIQIIIYPKAIKYLISMTIFIITVSSVWLSILCYISPDILLIRDLYTISGIQCEGIGWQSSTLGPEVTPRRVYLKALFFISTLLTQVNYATFCEECDGSSYLTVVISFFGMGLVLFITSKLTALAYLQNPDQEYTQEVSAAMKFLNKVGVPEDLKKQFSLYYMTCWNQHGGLAPERVLKKSLNYLLSSDFKFHIYGPCLKYNSIFSSSSNSFIRSVISESKMKIFNNGAQLLNEGFVQGDLYILMDGVVSVTVLNRRSHYLEKGALFGNFYDREHSQQLVSVYAATFVEALVIKSTHFHVVLNSYPVEKTLFEAYKNKYSQSGMKFVPGKVLGTESMAEDMEEMKAVTKKSFLHGKKTQIMEYIISLCSSFFSLYAIATFDVSPFMICVLYLLDFLHLGASFAACRRPISISGEQYITDEFVIRKEYLKRWDGFILDIIVAFPFETFALLFSKDVYLFIIFRVNRSLNMFNAWHIISNFCSDVTKVQLKLQVAILLMKLFMILNIFALVHTCNHIATSKVFYDTSFEKYSLFNQARMRVIASLVKFPYSLEASYKDFNEFVFVIRLVHLCLNPIILAIVLGNILFYICSYFYPIVQFIKQQRSIMVMMEYHKTTEQFSTNLKQYLRFLWDDHHGCQVPKLLTQVPLPLQQKMWWLLYSNHLNEHVLFSTFHEEFLQQLVIHFQTQFLFPGNMALESGVVDNCMYFVHGGVVDVYLKENKQWTSTKRLYTGSCFGTKQGLTHGLAHSHRLVAHSSVTLLKLDFNTWSYLLPYYPAIERKISNFLETI